MEFDNHAATEIRDSVPPQTLTASTNGASIDTEGFESLEYVVHVGAAITGGGFDITLQESDTGAFGGEETAVPAANIIGGVSSSVAIQVEAGDTNKVYRVGSIGKKRYQRCVLTETGTVTAGVLGVTVVLSHPYFKPRADQNT